MAETMETYDAGVTSEMVVFEGHQVRILNADGSVWDGQGEAWFVANDVAAAIGYADPRKSASQIINRNPEKFEGFRGVVNLRTPGGMQETTIINENGMYMFLMASDMPKAVAFQRRVSELLKQIRQRKAVVIPLGGNPLINQLQVLQQVVNGMVLQAQEVEMVKRQQLTLAGRVEQIANKVEKRMTSDFEMQLVTPIQIGKMFEPAISAREVNRRLRAAGLQWMVGGEWVATVEGRKYSSSEPIQLGGGKMVYQLKWQRRVKELLV